MDTRTGSRTRHILLGLTAAVLALGVAASCTLGALALRRISEQGESLSELSGALNAAIGGGTEAVTQENDVAVAGEYWIRSTEPISEAYISGDSSGLDEKQLETLSMASGVLDGIISGGMTGYEKEKAVYDWMCANLSHEGGVTVVVPTASEYSAGPYGVLKYGQAVCVGFATTFRMFMQMLGMDCMVVHNSYHSWNLVKLDDGEWLPCGHILRRGERQLRQLQPQRRDGLGRPRLGPQLLPRGQRPRVLLRLHERRAARGHIRRPRPSARGG